MQVQSLGWEDPLEEAMATHSSTLNWKIPWTEEPERLQSREPQRIGREWGDLACTKASFQFNSVTQLCPTLCDPMDCSRSGFPVHHQFPELAQAHVQRIGDAIQSSHPLWSPSPPALSLSQHQGLLQWLSSSHQVAKVLETQFQHQSFQWIFRVNFL